MAVLTGRAINRARLISHLLMLVAVLAWGEACYIHLKAALAQWLVSDAWQKTAPDEAVRPWPWADIWPIARLRSPVIDRDLIVLSGGHGSALAFGPGLIDGSAAPGRPGTTVIAGHRDTHFDFLPRLHQGATIQIQDVSRQWTNYRVEDAFIVDTRITPAIRLSSSFSELLLVTCYPFDAIDPGGPLRYVVRAEKMD